MTEQEMKDKARAAMQTIMDCMGYGGGVITSEVVDVFARSHNTQEQAFFRHFIAPIVSHMANRNEFIDGRNSAAQKWAKAAAEATDGIHMPFI